MNLGGRRMIRMSDITFDRIKTGFQDQLWISNANVQHPIRVIFAITLECIWCAHWAMVFNPSDCPFTYAMVAHKIRANIRTRVLDDIRTNNSAPWCFAGTKTANKNGDNFTLPSPYITI